MEAGTRVWLRSPASTWGWVPAVITKKESNASSDNIPMVSLTLRDDPSIDGKNSRTPSPSHGGFDYPMDPFSSPDISPIKAKNISFAPSNSRNKRADMSHSFRQSAANGSSNRPSSRNLNLNNPGGYYSEQQPFEVTITVDPEQLKLADHDDIKLRNLPSQFQLSGQDNEAGVITSPSVMNAADIVGGVDDLIGLTHLHEPAILHALRLRYDSDIIYTATGPILIAVNPFKPMPLYTPHMMEQYRMQGESRPENTIGVTPGKFKAGPRFRRKNRLPPHVYQTADDAYRSMMRGIENQGLVTRGSRGVQANQSILVSGESGAGKTVTTKFVLNYFAMLSRKRAEEEGLRSPRRDECEDTDVSIEQQVLQSNPILESFGNARTIRNDNSSRFGKYIDVTFSGYGKVSGASIETYLLEKVRLIHPGAGERNYHVFYQFLASATDKERDEFYLEDYTVDDFLLLSQSGTFDRRDGVSDEAMHTEMLDAMITIGFTPEQIQSLMRLICAVLFLGNLTFTPIHHNATDDPSCALDDNTNSRTAAALLGVAFEDLSSALTSRQILAGNEVLQKSLPIEESQKVNEALIKATYGAAFNYIVDKINESIDDEHEILAAQAQHTASRRHFAMPQASIGVLDIFGFETFETNSFEQICINYTNEALQQQFNKYVFKLEQQEYEREGILWKFIAFPDNQDVIDLIDQRRSGILSILDDQCMLPRPVDSKFCRHLYTRCDKHPRFSVSAKQRVRFQFSLQHYAGPVEYDTNGWVEKNKDQLPVKGYKLLDGSSFTLLTDVIRYVRTERRAGRGSIAYVSVGAQFSSQLKDLRERIDQTVPHYIRCLKPNDDLVPDRFQPKNVVEQLRCGGVLEAVRVSRAGYPTRYAHELFLGRYYILIKHQLGKNGILMSREERLRALVDKIAMDVWEEDHSMVVSLMEAEKKRLTRSPKRNHKKDDNTNLLNGYRSVAGAESIREGMLTPVNGRSAAPSSRRLTDDSHPDNPHEILRPESREEFLSLDFSSRCAVAGLQLGKSKVFIRREAFERIEAMRSRFFFDAATIIQSLVRGRYYRRRYIVMRAAAIQLQANFRTALAKIVFHARRCDRAARIIQGRWRSKGMKDEVYRGYREMRLASVKIQTCFRGFMAREEIKVRRVECAGAMGIQRLWRGVQTRKVFGVILSGVVLFQAVVRSKLVRRKKERKMRRAAAKAVQRAPLPTLEPILPTKEPTPPPTPVVNCTPPPITSPPQASPRLSPAKSALALSTAQSPPLTTTSPTDSATTLFDDLSSNQWARVENLLDANPELAEQPHPETSELPLHTIAQHPSAWTLLIDMILVLHPKALVHRDRMSALPIHHAAAHDNLSALEIIYSAYKEGIHEVDGQGRLPLHVAAEFDAVDAVKFLLAKSPEGAYTMIHRPSENMGGGLPLHVACRNYASIGVITALLAENFASAKRSDENGDLPLHMLLRCGDVVDQVVVKTLLTCFSAAVSRTDMNGDLPLAIALKHSCQASVVNTLLIQFPDAAGILDGESHSALHLAFENSADDRTILGLLNHAPELATAIDKESGLLPIQVAAQREHSPFIIHNLLKRDMPIDLKEKVRAQLLPHRYSWNHIVSKTDDRYHMVVSKVLQQCTQPQVLALAHVEDPDGKIALGAATPICKYELRVMLRLFNTLEVVNQRPAYTNPLSDTQIFYALRYEPPQSQGGATAFTVLHEDAKDSDALADYVEDFDDSSHVSGLSRTSARSSVTNSSKQTIEDRLRHIKKEKGQQVIAKLTSRSDVVERELRVRKEYHLSRHYVPAIISVHHTVQHAAYSEAMAEPGYCITMEGADTTAENLLLDLRKSGGVNSRGERFPAKSLKRIGISLLHMHEHGIVHGDFGTHNIGKFHSRWKLLGVGGATPIGEGTDPQRGFYHPPESIIVEKAKRSSIGKKSVGAKIVSITAQTTYDIWAYGVVLYEAIAAMPLPPYACRGKRAMSQVEIAKIGKWDDASLKKALKVIDDYEARDLLKMLLCAEEKRAKSMKDVLEHNFFKREANKKGSAPTAGSSASSRVRESSGSAGSRTMKQSMVGGAGMNVGSAMNVTNGAHTVRASESSRQQRNYGSSTSQESKLPNNGDGSNLSSGDENAVNGVPKPTNTTATRPSDVTERTNTSGTSGGSRKSGKMKALKNSLRRRKSNEGDRRRLVSN